MTFRGQIYLEKESPQSLIQESKGKVETLFETLGNEENVVEWLVKNDNFRVMLFREIFKHPENIKNYTSLKEPFTTVGKKPGDIDLLLVQDPSKSIAFECKIIKVSSISNQDPKLNKVVALEKGVIQVNKYLKLGFHKVYLLIIIEDDGRNYSKPNVIFNSASYDQLAALYKGTWKEKISPNIGIIYCKINQITNASINQNSVISLDIEKKAIGLPQNEEITDKIIQLENNISSN